MSIVKSSFSYQPGKYFLAVITATTVLWSVGGFMSFDPALADYYMLPMLLGLMMPAVFAAGFIWRQPDPAMRRDFVDRSVNPRLIRPWVFVGMLTLIPLSVVLAICLSLVLGGSSDQFRVSDGFSFETGFVPVLALLFLAAVFEELGWRGYGFESLEPRRTFLEASLLFGALWSLWHVPLLWVKDSYQYEILHLHPFFALNFFVGTALMGVIVSWVCHANRRSILATILFHFGINLAQESLSMTQETKCLQTLVLGVFVVLIVVGQRELFLGSLDRGVD